MGIYTDTGSTGTSTAGPNFNYSNNTMSGGQTNYANGQIQATIVGRSTSSGTLTFAIKKVSGYFRNGNTGKIFIVSQYDGNVFGTTFSITKSTTQAVSAKVPDYGDFEGQRAFSVYLVTSDGQYKQWGGELFIIGSESTLPPTVQTTSVDSITSSSAKFSGKINPNGSTTTYYFEYKEITKSTFSETTAKTLSGSARDTTVNFTVTGLNSNTNYQFNLFAENDGGYRRGSTITFSTKPEANNPPTTPSNPSPATASSNVPTSGTFSWRSSDPEGDAVNYTLYLGTSSSNMKYYNSGSGTSSPYDGLQPETKYFWYVESFDAKQASTGPTWTFTTKKSEPDNPGNPDNPDNPNIDDEVSSDVQTAANYLTNRGILKEERFNDRITRLELAKLALYALYGGESNLPSLVSDHFPTVYPDLQDGISTDLKRSAKALLYLEYGDGISPFDRNRAYFNPGSNIERNLVLKVLFETFNVKPMTSGTSYFSDFTSSMNCWGYAMKAYDLGITTQTMFRPYDYCTRGEAILFVYRILTGGKVSIPTPVNTEDASNSSFFIPANFNYATSNRMKGLESGNFNFYQKSFFNIDGYMPLDFEVTYNSCLSELPADFSPLTPMGKVWSHNYNIYMNLVKDAQNNQMMILIHNADGSMLVYDASLKSKTEGNHSTLTKLAGAKYQLKTLNQVTYTFEAKDTSIPVFYLTQINDRFGNAITFEYAKGSMYYHLSKASTFGRSLFFSYSGDQLVSVSDPMSRTVQMTYNSSYPDHLTRLVDPMGQATNFTYSTAAGETCLIKKIKLPKGNVINNTYQQRKLKSTQTNSNTPTTVDISTHYANGKTTSEVTAPITNSKSLTTQYTMDAKGKVTSMVDNESTDISITYGDANNPTLPTILMNNLTGITSTFTYNSNGLPTSTRVSGGGLSTTTSMTYNSDNQVTSVTDGNGNTTRFSYSGGAFASITDALSHVTTYTNNSQGRPTQITDPSGRKLNITYNSYGNMTKSSISALGISNSYVYDAVSRITRSTDGNGNSSTYSYDRNDNLLSFTDPKSNTISYQYDANDNLVGITNAKGGRTTLSYDDNDFLTGQSFQGHDKSFTYYDSGALQSATTPDGTTLSYTYDDAGRVTNNDYASFSYNSKGQLTSVSKDGKSVAYAYDGLGRTSSVEYDGKAVSYSYDANGNVTSITYPGSKTVSYSYDALNRVTAVTDWNGAKTTYSYNADGSIDYMQLPNKVKTSYSYDNGGRLTGMSTKRSNGSTIVGYGYTLDDNGNHVSVDVNDVFDHAPVLSAEDITYSYNSDNRITKAGSVSFGFDGNGNTTSRSGRTMKYDKVNNLISVSGDFNASYTYDGLGQRRSATRDGVTTKYVLSGNNVVAETNSSGTVQYYYVYGPTGLISRISASGDTRYYVADVRGSIVAMTDASTNANLTHKYQYDEFGKVTSSEEENINRFRYVGNKGVMYEADNLTFMRARYYDESIGRFLSEDPIWSTNLYPYCDNNPITRVDPEGTTYSVSLAGINQDLSYSPKVYNNDYYNSFVLGVETTLAVGYMVGNQDASLLKETWGRQKDIMGWSSSSSSSSTSSAAVSFDLSTLNNGQGMQMIHSSVDTHKGYFTSYLPAKVIYITELDGPVLNIALLARKEGQKKVEEILQKNPNFDSKKADFLIRSEIYEALQDMLPGVDSPWQINY